MNKSIDRDITKIIIDTSSINSEYFSEFVINHVGYIKDSDVITVILLKKERDPRFIFNEIKKEKYGRTLLITQDDEQARSVYMINRMDGVLKPAPRFRKIVECGLLTEIEKPKLHYSRKLKIDI